MNHKDSPISYLGLLRAHKVTLNTEDTWLITNLLALPFIPSTSDDSVTGKILSVFSGHSIFKTINRVALVRRLGESNQLQVVSSSNKSSIPNLMENGYSCFVSPTGSLFSLKHQAVRFFASAEDVVARFIADGLPPQRSIFRISKMRLGSGFCASVRAETRIAGYIFMNGDITNQEIQSDNLALVFSIVIEVAQKYLLSHQLSDAYYDLAKGRYNDYQSKRLTSETLKESVKHYLYELSGKYSDIQVVSQHSGQQFLISYGNVAQIIARALAILGQKSTTRIEVFYLRKTIEFRVDTADERPSKDGRSWRILIDALSKDAELLNLRFIYENSATFTVSIDADQASENPKIDYSVEAP